MSLHTLIGLVLHRFVNKLSTIIVSTNHCIKQSWQNSDDDDDDDGGGSDKGTIVIVIKIMIIVTIVIVIIIIAPPTKPADVRGPPGR